MHAKRCALLGGRAHGAQTTITFADGSTFTVEAINNSPTNVYVERIVLNGVDITTPYIRHDQIVAGGTLTFYMAAQPGTSFNLNNDEARRWASTRRAPAV